MRPANRKCDEARLPSPGSIPGGGISASRARSRFRAGPAHLTEAQPSPLERGI